jgi:hypothetical protein
MSTAIDPGLTLRIFIIGAGATIVMDAWLLLLRRAGIPASNFALVGRLLGHLSRGRWVRHGVARAPAIPAEALLGWATHYVIGIIFSALLVLAVGVEWVIAPTFLPALFAGVISVLAPLFVLQPAMGAGVASTKTPAPLRNSLKSLANHVVFGVGLYLAALATALVTRIAPHL